MNKNNFSFIYSFWLKLLVAGFILYGIFGFLYQRHLRSEMFIEMKRMLISTGNYNDMIMIYRKSSNGGVKYDPIIIKNDVIIKSMIEIMNKKSSQNEIRPYSPYMDTLEIKSTGMKTISLLISKNKNPDETYFFIMNSIRQHPISKDDVFVNRELYSFIKNYVDSN